MITRETTIEDNLRFAATLEQSHRRHQKRQDRAQVLLTVGVVLAVAFFFAIQPSNDLIENVFSRSQGNQTFKGDLGLISPFAKKKCEDIYTHSDQCKFVLKNCEESEVGMLHYLKFYFCTLGHVRPIAFIFMIIWLSLLFSAIGIAASDFFCPNLATLSQTLRMSESMAGVTFLALGNGSPDLFSTFAAMRVGSGSLAIGELIGAAFFITTVVSGSMAIVRPFKVSRKSFLRDVIFFSGAVAFSVGLLADGKITTWETSCMIAYYLVYVVVVVMATWYWGKRSKRRRTESRARHHYHRPDEEIEEVEDDEPTTADEGSGLLGDVRDLETAVDDEDETEEMEQGYASLQHRMSLIRPTIDGTRMTSHHNHRNIRPSLFGALEFRSLSTKLATASGVPHRHDRRHSTANIGAPQGHTLRRNLSDPYSQSKIQSAPPRQPRAPWHTAEGHSHPQTGGDYFNYPANNIQRSVSPLTQASIPEADEDETPDAKPTTYLAPPEELYGSRKSGITPSLHLDVSDDTLVVSPGAISMELPRTPGEPLGFRDVQEVGSTSSDVCHRVYSWWPYSLLPDPYFLYQTLFPTLLDFGSKSWFQKILAVIAIPAVFCLTITLPVVDNETPDADGEIKLPSGPSSPTTIISSLPDASSDVVRPISSDGEMTIPPRGWNRWLTGVQCICAPLFMTFIFFQNKGLLLPMLYALISGLVALALLLTFSSPYKPPKWHKSLCAVGFVVAIGWISTIADEVVGILRAFGAILGVSEAILGVTVFAMGNSLSDFVADVTVARMGYPMMAMSACFGGPMLNILLGVGVAGLYLTITSGAEYHVHISPTLLVSTVSLFLTLSSMLIVVPRNKWRMTRAYGICLVVFFTISTATSVLVEILL